MDFSCDSEAPERLSHLPQLRCVATRFEKEKRSLRNTNFYEVQVRQEKVLRQDRFGFGSGR